MNTLFEYILKPVMTFVAKPHILLPAASVALVLTLKYYRTVTKPRIAGAIGAVLAGLLVVSCFDPNFKKNILKPDNVPIVLLLFGLLFFLWLSLRRAAINDEAAERGEPPLEARMKRESVLVWPDLVFVEFICAVVVTLSFVVLSFWLNAPLLNRANLNVTPNPSKAPWYFMNLQELLLHMHPALAGVVVPTIALILLAAIPYIDRSNEGQGEWFAGKNAAEVRARVEDAKRKALHGLLRAD